jgi:hypothetical protein
LGGERDSPALLWSSICVAAARGKSLRWSEEGLIVEVCVRRGVEGALLGFRPSAWNGFGHEGHRILILVRMEQNGFREVPPQILLPIQ